MSTNLNDFVIEEDGSLIEYNGNDSDVIVPDGVTVIYYSAFGENKNLKSIKIPNSVKDLGEDAFKDCINLTNIIFPDGLKEINRGVFENCESLKSIIIPDGVTRIWDHAFKGCSRLNSVSFPNSLKKIGSGAFELCNFTDVSFPNSLVSIGYGAFSWCTKLKNVSIPSSVEVIDTRAFEYCKSLDNIEFPDSVKAIHSDASEHYKSLNYIEFPDSVKRIGSEAFYGCGLSTVVLSANTRADSDAFSCGNVYQIGRGPLRNCNGSIKEIITPDLFVIENGVLQGYLGRDEEIVIPDGVKVIKKWSFSDDENKKNIKSIKIPNSVKIIEDCAFEDCFSLRNLYIPASVEKIGKNICKMTDNVSHLINIEVDENNKYYSSLNGNLYNKDRTKLLQYAVGKEDSTFTIPDGVVTIEDSAFMSCVSLNTVKIPNSVVYIKDDAFRFCSGLSEILIPDSVKELGYEVFCACHSLKTVKIGSGLQNGSFYDCPYIENVCIKDVAQYCNAEIGSSFGNFDNDGYRLYLNGNLVTELVIPEGITVIPCYAFCDCISIKNVVLPKSLSKIEKDAFSKFLGSDDNSSYPKLDVYYKGTEEEWSKVKIDPCNEDLGNATMHFNFKQEENADVHTDKTISLSSNNDVLFEVSRLKDKHVSEKEILDILKGKNISVKDILEATAKLSKNSAMIKSFCDSKIVPKIDELLQKDYSVGECLKILYKTYPRVLVNRAMCDRLYNEDIKL